MVNILITLINRPDFAFAINGQGTWTISWVYGGF
jgi:hypothetical protein